MRTAVTGGHSETGIAVEERPPRAARGIVLSYSPAGGANPRSHESVTQVMIAKKLAVLKGYEYGGRYADGTGEGRPVYLVPSCTLVGRDAATALGIRSEHDLFGGVVPFPFVCTKAITHRLLTAYATTPEGWSHEFARAVQAAVLPGLSAFSRDDARLAGARMLERGPVRVKPSLAVGGRDQVVATDAAGVEAALAGIDESEVAACGVVLEENLGDVITYSVGQVRVGDLVATYCGTQKLARDNRDAEVYGGSELIVARGEFAALLSLDIGAGARLAVEQARTYDSAARRYYPGFFASRCNYDIARGRDSRGNERCGVLEQSWRVGGASGAEIAALEAFHADPTVAIVRAACTEVYGDEAVVPEGATVYFHGVDEGVGFITKYVTVTPYADPR